MELQTLKASTRVAKGKGDAGRERRTGNVPGVLYGGGGESISLKLDAREFERLIHSGGEHAIVQLSVEDQPELSSPAMLRAVQHHPIRGEVLHADFQRIRLDERITTLVPLELVGHCKGTIEGGVLDFQLREIEVECLALEVPEKIEIDTTELGIGDSIHVEQIPAPPNVTIVTELTRSVVAVHAPRVIKTAEEEAAEAAAEAEAAEDAAAAESEAGGAE